MSGISAERVHLVLNGLEFLNPSQECKDKVAPFLCLHLFGLCGDTGIRLQPTLDQCVRIRDDTCYREWREAAMFNIELPDCSNLPLSVSSCEHSGYNQDINDTGNGAVCCKGKTASLFHRMYFYLLLYLVIDEDFDWHLVWNSMED